MRFFWLPLHTLGLSALACVLMLLPSTLQSALHWHQDLVVQQAWWRAMSGHWVHADAQHLGWNALALLLIGAYIERRSRWLLWACLGAGTLAVNLYLLSGFASVTVYCGLSGILNTLLFVALWLLWRETGSRWVAVSAVAATAKIVIEIAMSESLLTSISWPPVPAAHLAGMVIAPLVIWCWERCDGAKSRGRSRAYEYLDASC